MIQISSSPPPEVGEIGLGDDGRSLGDLEVTLTPFSVMICLTGEAVLFLVIVLRISGGVVSGGGGIINLGGGFAVGKPSFSLDLDLLYSAPVTRLSDADL